MIRGGGTKAVFGRGKNWDEESDKSKKALARG